MKKTYVCFENNQYIVRTVQGFVPESVICECNPSDDLEVMSVVDDIDELTQEVVGKKLEFSEEKYEAKQVALLNIERNKKLEALRQLRDAKLPKVDLLVNLAVLYAWTTTEKNELKAYREALLNITEPYKNSPILLDSLVLSEVVWPTEPSES
jgi:hypothetical protein